MTLELEERAGLGGIGLELRKEALEVGKGLA